MQAFIARENIKRFKKQLEDCNNAVQRATLVSLLSDEEAHLKSLESAVHPN